MPSTKNTKPATKTTKPAEKKASETVKAVETRGEASMPMSRLMGMKQYFALKRRIVDPYTLTEFHANPMRPTEPIEMSSWLECQIDAGLIAQAPDHGA